MGYRTPVKCPVCGGNLSIRKMQCETCDTELSGCFDSCRFCRLDEKSLEFLLVFLKNRGSIKEVERELGISYPTVRNNLDALLASLGLMEKEKKLSRSEILQMLAAKEITVKKAKELLSQL